MDDEELLQATVDVARRERVRRTLDVHLDALVEGRISAEARASLARASSSDGEVEAAMRVFRPLADSAKDRIAARALAELNRAPQRRRRWVAPLGTGAGTLALAAAIALFIGHPAAQTGTLPPYELAFVGGDQALRGAPTETVPGEHRFSRTEPFRVLLRPRTGLEGAVGARVFLRRGGEVRRWDAPLEVSSEGAIRIATSLETLPANSGGAWEMAIVVGRPEDLPTIMPSAADATFAHGWQILRTRVRFDLE